MKITDKQVAALEYIHRNPGAKVGDIVAAAGATAAGHNGVEFGCRLIDSGFAQVILTGDAAAVIEGDGGDLDAAATVLYHHLHPTG